MARDENGRGVMVVYEVDTDELTRIALGDIGLSSPEGEIRPGYISGDGNTVVFPARADIFSGDRQIYAYSLVDDTYTVVSVDEQGEPDAGDFTQHKRPISDDGLVVVFVRGGDFYVAEIEPDPDTGLADAQVEVRLLPTHEDHLVYELSGNGRFLGYSTWTQNNIHRLDLTNDQDVLLDSDTADGSDLEVIDTPAVDNQGSVYYSVCDWTTGGFGLPTSCTLYRAQ